MVNIPGVGVLTWEPATGTLIDANDAFLEMSGHTRQQVSSGQITWRKLTPEEHVPESERQMEQLAHKARRSSGFAKRRRPESNRCRRLCRQRQRGPDGSIPRG
jgi:hypothetical protein